MKNGIIYYTDNRISGSIWQLAQSCIKDAGLPITSTSLKPIDFGKNIVVEGKRSYPTMVKQILVALENSEADNVFFCENDVLYHTTHFDFTPKSDNILY